MIPSWDHTGTPNIEFDGFFHFTSSTTSGSASLMSSRILLRVSPRQSPKSAHCERLFYRKRSLGLHVADHGPHNVLAGRVVRFDDHAEASFAYLNNTVWRRRLV